MAPRLAQGYILLFSLVFFALCLTITVAFVGSITTYAKAGRFAVSQAQALSLAEAGIDKAAYSLNQNGSYTGEANTELGGGTFTTSVVTAGSTKRITSTGSHSGSTVTVRATLSVDTSAISFNYGVQVGQGGLVMSNSSRIIGNVHSSGSILMANSSRIEGDAVSSGPTGLIDGSESTITGSAYAHTLRDVDAGIDAYYVTASNVEASGANCPNSHCHPNSPDEPAEPFPITDAQIDEWEDAAAAGGTISGPYTINASTQLGPKKINGDLIVNGSLTLTGPVWVSGDIDLNNNAAVTLAGSLGNSGTVLIAHNPADPAGKGDISISNDVAITGNGNPGSFPILIAMKTSGTVVTLSNTADGVVLFAPYGTIAVSNSAGANQITAYRLQLSNSATLTYVSGLQSANFTSGPGGSWAFVPGSYTVTQ